MPADRAASILGGKVPATNDSKPEVSAKQFDSLKKMAGKNFGKFAVQVQHLSEEVQLQLIAQLPEFRQLATAALTELDKSYQSFIKSADEGDRQVHEAYREWRATLDAMIRQPNLTLDEQLRIAAEIAKTVEGQRQLNAEARAVKAAAHAKNVMGAVAIVSVITLAVTGGKFMLDQGDA